MQNKSIITILKEVSMFSSLTENELKALANLSHLYDYKKGTTLFVEGEMSNALMILIEGIVSIFKHDKKGNEIVMGYFNRYSLLAEAPTLRRSLLPSSAKFQSDGILLKIDIDSFEKLFITHPNISSAIIQSLLNKIELLQQNIHFNIASTSREKILHFYQKSSTLTIDLKQYEVASILGMVPETFSRTLKKLIEEDKIVKNSRGYRVK
jgi:CRP/FNR family transcriptional regulator